MAQLPIEQSAVDTTPSQEPSPDAFERLHLRKPLAQAFESVQVEGEARWRAASRVRMVLLPREQKASALFSLLSLLEVNPEVRWLAGVHEAGEKTYFIQEPFEQLLWWIQLPSLVEAAAGPTPEKAALLDIAAQTEEGVQGASACGYDFAELIKTFAATLHPPAKETETAKGTAFAKRSLKLEPQTKMKLATTTKPSGKSPLKKAIAKGKDSERSSEATDISVAAKRNAGKPKDTESAAKLHSKDRLQRKKGAAKKSSDSGKSSRSGDKKPTA
jgi:hypothetical protein